MLLLIFAIQSTAPVGENDLAKAYASANLALNGIKEAEDSGADVLVLIQRFNYALDFLHQAETSNFRSCSAYEACIKSALNIFSSISNDSLLLQKETNKASGYREIIVLGIYIPVTAFLALLSIFYFYHLWKLSDQKKFLNRKIRKNQEK